MPKQFHKVAKVHDVKPGSMREVSIGKQRLALCNVDGDFFAIADVCTHDGGTLSDGDLDGAVVECPRHGARFNIRTGQVVGPPAVVPVDTYEVRLQGDDVLVAMES